MESAKYNHIEIEKKRQQIWWQSNCFATEDCSDKPRYYVLAEFPYLSGEGLHVGHLRSYTAMDVVARLKRAQGCNVLFPLAGMRSGYRPKITPLRIASIRQKLRRGMS